MVAAKTCLLYMDGESKWLEITEDVERSVAAQLG